MSHFVGIAILSSIRSRPSLNALDEALGKRIRILDISNTPLGDAISANRERIVFALVSGGTSTDLLGLGHARASIVDDCRRALAQIYRDQGAIAVLVHFARGRLATERVAVKQTVTLALEAFLGIFPNLEEDVRYVVTYSTSG